MSIAFRITLIIVSVFTLLYMCKKVKQEKLQIEYSIFFHYNLTTNILCDKLNM